ncbi:MAG TPA: hypothetical protein VK420_12045 [Longimicrobium sp.]|jgi:hypothetical protein|nr:hypothetical protein [Longimicrobium sp.]
MTKGFVGVLTLLLACISAPAAAQQQAPPATTQPTTADVVAQGTMDGRSAAEGKGTGGYFAGGIVGGLTLGLIGTGITYAVAANSTAEVPSTDLIVARERGAAYTEAYQAAFRDRVKGRRKSSALTGGLLGTAVLVAVVASAGS